jgi:UDP-glucose 4-epimerase
MITKKNIIVTGGAGFIGTNLIKFLSEKNYNILSLDNYSTGKKENHLKKVKYINFDITNSLDSFDNKKIDIIFHLAAQARIQPSFKDFNGYFKTNAIGTVNICNFCIKNNIPLIYAGSSSHHYCKYKNPYTFTKDVGEDTIKLYQKIFNLKAAIVRFYNVYGPYQLKNSPYANLIGRWEYMIETNQPLVIYGSGKKCRDFTHVEDIVDGLIKIYDKQAWNYIFELGRGKNYSILEIAQMFNHPIRFEKNLPGEAKKTLCRSSLASKVLGWKPQYDIENYIKNIKKIDMV